MIYPKTFPTLTTSRMEMRSMEQVDVQDFLPIAMRRGRQITDTIEASNVLRDVVGGFETQQTLCWGMFFNGKLIGMCGFFRGFAENRGEIGYILHPEYRREGFMLEAIDAAVKYGFQTMELDEIHAFTASGNHASRGLLQKVGFTWISTQDLLAQYVRNNIR